jgi:predicted acylesterase/phospholipase RssA
MNYDTMVLSGGAIRGFGLLGAIQHLQDQNRLAGIRKFIGTSIGAILSYLLCIGYTPTEVMVSMSQKGFFEKISNLDVMNVMNGMGAVSFSILQEQLEKMTVQKIKKYITLSELHTRFGKELVCCTYNKTTQTPEYISFRSHPDMNCLTAIRMSASLPFLFDEFLYEDCHYIDGGVADNFPICQILPEDTAIAIRLTSSAHGPDHEDKNVVSDIYSTILIPIHRIEQIMIERMRQTHPKMDIVDVHLPSYTAVLLNVSTTEKFDMFSVGYDSMRKYYQDTA